jgi:hypothetical protein
MPTPTYEMRTGNRIRLVKISAATPRLAASASWRMTPMSIVICAANPAAAASTAVSPAPKSRRKVRRAATCVGAPRATSCVMPFIFWTPWLMPIANTRNGTSIEYGSSANPSARNAPNCHTTAMSEQATTSKVLRPSRIAA